MILKPQNHMVKSFVNEGFDSFFRNFTPPNGPHSEIQCSQFEAFDEDRLVDMTHFVSGVDLRHDLNQVGDLPRSNAFWYITGSDNDPLPDPGPLPGLFDANAYPTAIGFQPPNQPNYPLRSSAELEWDNF